MEAGPANVESSQLDRRLVKTSFIRVTHRETFPGGDALIRCDVRFCQPSQEHPEIPVVYFLEHSIAEHMRDHIKQLIDFSPVGCQTGFYALTLGIEPEEFIRILKKTLVDVVHMTGVPAANEIRCGWRANHSLGGTQQAAQTMLNHREEWDKIYSHQEVCDPKCVEDLPSMPLGKICLYRGDGKPIAYAFTHSLGNKALDPSMESELI